jgi:formate hydrogenlyase subunit 6/NADH:ubiquinone oxidoreductase subunit I
MSVYILYSIIIYNYFCPKAAIVSVQNYEIIETKHQHFLMPQTTEEKQMRRLRKPVL